MGSANYNKCITLIKQGGLNHEKELIYLKTNSEGDIPVMAYKFAEGYIYIGFMKAAEVYRYGLLDYYP